MVDGGEDDLAAAKVVPETVDLGFEAPDGLSRDPGGKGGEVDFGWGGLRVGFGQVEGQRQGREMRDWEEGFCAIEGHWDW